MFKRAVVGIDGNAGGRDAVALAAELAGDGAEIALANVYVFSPVPAHGSSGIFTAGERVTALATLEEARRDLDRPVELHAVASPSVGRGLHELAEDLGADLIVVGSSHRGLMGRVLLGDEMRSALNGAPCAVAIAPSGYRDRPRLLTEIGVGYDGSPESQNALAVARRLAERHGAQLSAFEALTLGPAGYVTPRHPGETTIEAEVEQARDRLAQLGGLTAHAAYGDPAEELALYGAGLDLLVVGSRGYGPLGRL